MIQAPMVTSLLGYTKSWRSKSDCRGLVPVRRHAILAARAGIFLSANDPIVVLDLDGRYLDANRAACALLDYTLAELRTMTAHQINHASEDVWRSLVDDLMRSGPRTAETTYYTRKGPRFPWRSTCARPRTADVLQL